MSDFSTIDKKSKKEYNFISNSSLLFYSIYQWGWKMRGFLWFLLVSFGCIFVAGLLVGEHMQPAKKIMENKFVKAEKELLQSEEEFVQEIVAAIKNMPPLSRKAAVDAEEIRVKTGEISSIIEESRSLLDKTNFNGQVDEELQRFKQNKTKLKHLKSQVLNLAEKYAEKHERKLHELLLSSRQASA